MLEIGPGIGTMTQYLAEAAREVVAVEIDKTLIPILENDTLKDWDNVTVINEDILKVDIAALAQEKNGGKPIKVVANLPYYITTPIIMGLFENHVPISSITIMVQKRGGRQNAGGPGTKDYGACHWLFSIMQSHRSLQMFRRTVLCHDQRWEVL